MSTCNDLPNRSSSGAGNGVYDQQYEQLHKCKLNRLKEEEIQKFEEERLNEIITFCQRYNEQYKSRPKFSFNAALNGDVGQQVVGVVQHVESKQLPTHNDRQHRQIQAIEDELKYDMDSPSSTLTACSQANSQTDGKCDFVTDNGKFSNDLMDHLVEGDLQEDLRGLLVEEALLKGEIDDIQQQQFSDAEDEELVEFQRIEKEIKLSELEKCLSQIEEQINKIKSTKCNYIGNNGLSNNVAPLAEFDIVEDEEESSLDAESINDDADDEDETDVISEISHDRRNFGVHFADSRANGNAKNSLGGNSIPEIDHFSRAEGGIDRNRTQQRPLTLYLPSPDNKDLDLIVHTQTLGHDIYSFAKEISLTAFTAFGFLWKLSSNTGNTWRKRFFHFDRINQLFTYYKSIKEYKKLKKPKGGVSFDEIQDVYVDHNRIKPNLDNQLIRAKPTSVRQIFVVSTSKRLFVLSTFKPEIMRIWIDVIFTGAQAYDYY